ncbi:CHAT domain-containing protein [Nonomuraea turkmeniaca]|uniref:CHAT domain-containing protein n=1 Tax=Nonomuraea turkmeniaca TaxID=103838 RepID=A0A5S4FEM0_9ACTN|nr:CHAT domain-containing protein [Nonomuraea turkmeniaca]TMR17337.1 CHAT domain-containing protein [Nonomuraea turkmeniaca]
MSGGLVNALESHYRRFTDTGDPGLILDPAMRVLAMRVLQVELAAQRADPYVLYLVGMVLWSRGEHLPDGAGDDDGDVAYTLFEMVYRDQPEMLAPELQAAFDARQTADGDPERPESAPGYSAALARLGRAERSGDPAAIADAARWFEARLSYTADDSPLRPYLIMHLGAAQRAIAMGTSDPAPATQAVWLMQEAVAGFLPGHPARAGALVLLGSCHRIRYERTGDPDDIDAAVERAEEAVAEPGGDEPPWRRRSGACMARRTRFEISVDPADIHAAAEHARQLIAEAPRNPQGLVALANAANALAGLHEFDSAAETLNEAVELQREIVELLPRDHPRWAPILADLAGLLALRHAERGAPEDAAQALEAADTALRNLPDHHPERVRLELARETVLRVTGGGQDTGEPPLPGLERYSATGDAESLRQAVAAARQRLAGLPPYHPDQVDKRIMLATLLAELGTWDLDPEQLRESVELAREALRRCRRFPGLGHRLTQLATVQLATSLAGMFLMTNERTSVDEAVDLLKEIVDGDVTGLVRGSLAETLRSRAMLTGSVRDIDEGEALMRAALDGEADPVMQAACQAALCRMLRMRFELTGRAGDLDEATEFARLAARMPPDAPGWVHDAIELSHTLLVRHVALQDPADLDEAVEVARWVLTSYVREPKPRALVDALTALALSLYVRQRDAPDIAEATESARKALALVDEHSRAPALRLNLALCLLASYQTTGEPESLGEAADQAEAALNAISPGYRQAHRYYSLLGDVRAEQYKRSGERSVLDAALAASEQAVRTVPQDGQMRAVLGVKYARLLTRDDSARAYALYKEAATLATAPVDHRIAAAWDWGELGARSGNAEEALAGYATVVELMPLLLWRGLPRDAQERLVTRWRGAASLAASWALELDRPQHAVELLEQGRCLMWSQLAETRTDLSRLRSADPELAARMEAVRVHLDPAAAPVAVLQGNDTDLTRHARAWDELVRRARELPGLADLLRPPSFAESSRAAGDGAVVLVNCAERRSDALIVTPGQVRVVPLEGCGLQDVGDRAVAWQDALAAIDRGTADVGAYLTAYRTVADTLAFLWDHIAEPVLSALSGHDGAELVRVWWVPTGPMALLPLHAAGHHAPGDARTVLDRAVSSYTPTLRDLAQARARTAAATGGSGLVVAVSHAPGVPSLPHAGPEADRVLARLPEASPLREEEATVARVLDELPRRSHLHLACHGDQEVTDSSSARLLLHDGALWLRDLPRLNLAKARLAYLSACRTATGAIHLTDEAVHLAGALHMVGFPEVIATAWQISDELAPEIADLVYAGLAAGGWDPHSSAAPILRSAVLRARDLRPGDPLLWTAYLHVGP